MTCAPRPAAIFDVDRTLLVRESGEAGFLYLWKRRVVSPFFLLKVAAANQLYRRGLLSVQRITEICVAYYRGRALAPFIEGAREFYEGWLRPIVCPIMRAKVEEHRRAGDLLVLLSASVDYYLKPLADDLGFDRLICSKLETDADGVCTGRTAGPLLLGEHKLAAALKLAREEGIDLAASTAYADHPTDLPLLEAVGHPVAVRPLKAFRAVALARGWPIIEG